ncbi:SGNH/GDSL hydrolase family protein [Streptomyces sp. TRM 70351]|uniref:SGNH/GDSL hydrolase family protein n=1 Tax=Streptomyces sp. TRM 70351 TaxID=3116552 RepID=UPI002E7B615C|nr:SGNH/GDSL hydrolase family protein [Streptomyces sp. TRM 70351]MEE1928508.1 SGNH/GDSL hydrolase family protein [Streptomyces sp. TRM 70351]
MGVKGRSRGRRTAAGVAAALALATAAACSGGGDGDAPGAGDAAASARPAPSPASDWDTSPDSVAAIGDSITTGFDTCSLLADCPEASWATGTAPEVDSLADRLLGDPSGRVWNHAAAGAKMADLPEQAARAAAHDPALVTVLIGANDACGASVARMTPTEQFRADFTEAMETLRREAPDTQVYVASVPDLMRLWSVGRESVVAARVWQLGICPSMLRDPAAVDPTAAERRERVAERVDEYNTVLREVCAADEHCRHDGGAVHDYRFSAEELSPWDWFHPSRSGQRVLAELAFRHVTAPQAP